MLLSFDRTATRRYGINATSLLLLGFPLFLDFFPSRNRKLLPCGPVTVDWWWNQQIVGSAEAQVGVMDEWEFRVEIWALRLPWSSQERRSSAFRDLQHACCFSSVFLLFLNPRCKLGLCVCVFMITLMCVCVCESVLPSTACRMEVVKVSGGPSEAELRRGISNVAGPLPLAF